MNKVSSNIIRFDDTNPDAEEEIYFEWIIKIVKWLGMFNLAALHLA